MGLGKPGHRHTVSPDCAKLSTAASDEPHKIEYDVMYFTVIVPMCCHTKEQHDIGRSPAVHAYVDLPREMLELCVITREI